MSTKEFPIDGVLSVVTDLRLVHDVGVIYEILNWMTGESLFIHQLPRVGREAVPIILALHPALRRAVEESEQVTPDNCLEWIAAWKARYGETLAVPKMTIADHERIDLLSELAEKLSPDRVLVVGVYHGKPGDDRS